MCFWTRDFCSVIWSAIKSVIIEPWKPMWEVEGLQCQALWRSAKSIQISCQEALPQNHLQFRPVRLWQPSIIGHPKYQMILNVEESWENVTLQNIYHFHTLPRAMSGWEAYGELQCDLQRPDWPVVEDKWRQRGRLTSARTCWAAGLLNVTSKNLEINVRSIRWKTPRPLLLLRDRKKQDFPPNYQQCLQDLPAMRTWSKRIKTGSRWNKVRQGWYLCWNMLKHVETCWNVEAPKPWIKAKKKEAILGFVQTAMHPPRNIKAEATHSDTKRHASDPGHGNLGLIWIGFANGQYEMPVDSLWPLSMACLDYQGSQSRSATI